MAAAVGKEYASWLTSVATLFVCLAALLKFVLLVKRAYFTPLRAVPGPWYAPWTNLVLKWKVISGQRTIYIHDLHQRYGPYIRIAPDEVSVFDVEGYKTIYKSFNKSPWYETFTDARSSPGLFAMTDPNKHNVRRRLFAPLFSNTAVLKLEPIVREKVNLAVEKIKRDASTGTADLLKWFTFMATDLIGQLSFGRSFEMLEREERPKYMDDVDAQLVISGLRTELPLLWNVIRWVPIPAIRKLREARDRLNAFGEAAVQSHKDYLARTKDIEKQATTFFSRFLDPSKRTTELSDFDIASEAGNLVVAGSDTTALNSMWLVYALLHPRNAAVKEKLVKELDTLPLNAPARDILNLRYLQKVVDESLRLYGSAASLPRIVPPEGASIGGYFFPAGLTISSQSYTLHRDPVSFQDPERYEQISMTTVSG